MPGGLWGLAREYTVLIELARLEHDRAMTVQYIVRAKCQADAEKKGLRRAEEEFFGFARHVKKAEPR